MSIEWKLKTSVNLLCLAIDRSVNILSGRERERDRERRLFIGLPADSNTDACLVAITRPVRQSDASLPCLLSSSSPPLQGQRTSSRARSCVRVAEDVSMHV